MTVGSLQRTATQIAAKVEGTAGTWESALDTDATTTAWADFVFANPQTEFAPEFAPRDVHVPHLLRPAAYAPARWSDELPMPVRVRFAAWLAGHEDNDGTADVVEAPIARLLSACGILSASVTRYPVSAWSDAVTDVILNSEQVDGDGGGSLRALSYGSAVADVNDSVYLLSSTITGSASAGETLTGAVGAASATMGTIDSVQGWGLLPWTDDALSKTLSILVLEDGRQLKVRGCRGNATISFRHTVKPVVLFDFLGVLEEAPSDRDLLSGSDLPVALHHVGPTCNGLGFDMDDEPGGSDPYGDPTFSEVRIEGGVDTVLHPDANNPKLYDYCRIQARTPQLVIDLDERTAHDYEAAFVKGHAWHQAWSVGSDAGNIWEARVPAAVMQSREPFDRGDRRAQRYTFALSAGETNEDAYTTGDPTQRKIAPDGEFALYNR